MNGLPEAKGRAPVTTVMSVRILVSFVLHMIGEGFHFFSEIINPDSDSGEQL